MKTIEEAKQLALGLEKIGDAFNINTDIIYTDMSQPLGRYAGLHCEVLEALDCLKGNGPKDLIEVSFQLGAKILIQSKIVKDIQSANRLMLDTINNGNALKKFEEIVNKQNGDVSYLNSKKIIPEYEITVKSDETGFVSSLKTEKIGWSLVEIGCGRKTEKDKLDYSAGIEFIKKIGDKVNRGDTIYRIFGNDIKKLNIAKIILEKTYFLTDAEVLQPKLIIN
jgi:pyrimidine-nucleoside phosphorylase